MRWHATGPWFGPKILGWGWRPIAWQGWLITLLLVVLLVGIRIEVGKSLAAFALMVCVLMAFGVVAFVTGGRPGHTGIS